MTAALYRNMDREEITLDQLNDACSDTTSTLAGCFLILRVFAENGDEDTTDLCNALAVLLKHVDKKIDNVRPYLSPTVAKHG